MLKARSSALLLLLPSALGAGLSPAEVPASTTGAPAAPSAKVIYPMEAALVQSLSSKSLQPGGHVLAKLEKDWSDGTCTLPRGTAVRGDVLRTQTWSPAAKQTSATLLFHYTCPGGDPKAAMWIALMGPEDLDLAGLHDGNPVSVQAFRSSSFGGAGNFGSPTGANAGHPGDESGRQNPNLPVFLDAAADHAHPRPPAVKTGQVWRVPDVSLAVGAGPDDSTVIRTKNKALHVPAGSAVVLLPAAVAVVASAPAPGASAAGDVAPAAPLKPPAPAFHEITTCVRPACSLAADVPASAAEMRASATLSLRDLRYNRQRQGEMRKLGYAEAMAFVGPQHLLFTFDPHTLVAREAEDRPEDRPHMVRAVLFNTATGRVEHTLDWRVPDSRQYLWPVAGDRVLVHNGRRLQWLGAAMKLQTAFAPEGPIAFVRLSPDRRHIVVGVTRELHTREEHAEMAAVDPNGPEEQVAVHLLNGQLEPVSVTEESSRALPPVLTDHGRVMLLHVGGPRWHYKLLPWGETAHVNGESVAYVTSACLPEMSGAGRDLLLVTGCENHSLDHWYRVLRLDGSPVLKGVLHPQDLAPLPAGETADGSFALALPSGGPGYLRNSPFRAEDISSELVRVHRADDGAAMFAARVEAPAAASQPLAFAPEGDRLAVLDGEEIRLFTLRASPVRAAAQ